MASGSNSGRYTRCPYYRWEYEARITCEDTYRHFECKAQKNAWMDMYCDSWDWMKCPYAADLTEAYERYEKGDEKALENHENEALRKELRSMAMKLGRSEKKARKLTYQWSLSLTDASSVARSLQRSIRKTTAASARNAVTR